MSNRKGFAAAPHFKELLLVGPPQLAGGAGVSWPADAGGKATADADGENEMNLGRLPPARAVTLTIAPRPFSAEWQLLADGEVVTRRSPEVDIDSGEEGGVSVWTVWPDFIEVDDVAIRLSE